jgi:N-dimethylarginine dimethylaminohydrolase
MSRLLVCPPDYFGIEYEINPWMRRSNAVDPEQAVCQWRHLMQVLEQDVGALLERMTPVPGLPDLVFTANAGIVVGRKAAGFAIRSGNERRHTSKTGFAGEGTTS